LVVGVGNVEVSEAFTFWILFLIEDEDKVPEDFNLLIYYQNKTDKSIEYVIVIYWVNLWEELRFAF